MTVLLLLVGLASAAAPTCEEAVDTYIGRLEGEGQREAYLCLAYAADALPALLAAATATWEDDGTANRYTRALALHLMLRLDRPLTAEESRALGPSDRRLLSDAVRARRGRATPSAEHAKVFEQFDWYQPDGRYNNGMLTELDRNNIEMIDNPPPPEKPAEPTAATAADALAQGAPAEVPRGLCGCAAGPVGAPWLLGLLALVRRRKH